MASLRWHLSRTEGNRGLKLIKTSSLWDFLKAAVQCWDLRFTAGCQVDSWSENPHTWCKIVSYNELLEQKIPDDQCLLEDSGYVLLRRKAQEQDEE